MKKFTAFFTAALILFCSTTTTAFALSNEIYRVKEDDTLWKISRKYEIPLFDVIEANKQFADPNLIYPEDTVYIPNEIGGRIGASMTDDGASSRKHTNFGKNASSLPNNPTNSKELEVLNLVNAERKAQGLSALSMAKDISNVARLKSEDMRDSKYFDHNSPKYGSPFDMLKSFGINYKTAGENIAKGQQTAEAVMKAWMNSEGHKRNILHPAYKEIGIGYVTDQQGTSYWTQEFVAR